MASRRQPVTGAGPSNSNNSETVVPETPGLVNALAEVVRLRAMIEAQNTPETRTQSSNQNRLADVLEALSRRLTRDETLVDSKLAKIPDPPLLTDGIEPTFKSWKL
jgi:hypothetical protein